MHILIIVQTVVLNLQDICGNCLPCAAIGSFALLQEERHYLIMAIWGAGQVPKIRGFVKC